MTRTKARLPPRKRLGDAAGAPGLLPPRVTLRPLPHRPQPSAAAAAPTSTSSPPPPPPSRPRTSSGGGGATAAAATADTTDIFDAFDEEEDADQRRAAAGRRRGRDGAEEDDAPARGKGKKQRLAVNAVSECETWCVAWVCVLVLLVLC